MKHFAIFFFLLCLSLPALAADSLNCRMIDWLDAPTGHNFNHYGTYGYYEYTGTEFWDLAMGDTFLVWVHDNRSVKYIDPWNITTIDTFFTDSGFVTADFVGCAVDSVRNFFVGDEFVFAADFRTTYARFWGHMRTPWASYHFAALEDSFLYTVSYGDLTCINVADPESIFVYRTCSPAGPHSGLEVIDGYAYTLLAGSSGDEYISWPIIVREKYDMINSAAADRIESIWEGYLCLGDLAADDEFVYYVSSEMEGPPGWIIGESNLYVWGTDTTYNFESHWDGQGVFGVDVISENLLAVGFEYGLSILNISNLDSIYEAAYYIDTLGNIDFTHFALKEDRLYAMGHPRDSYATLYMFRLAECVISGIEEKPSAKPKAFAISAYPNPFNSAVTISLDCHSRENGNPEIEIYDINGRIVTPSTPLDRGEHGKSPLSKGDLGGLFVWTPAPALGSGVYLVRATICEQATSAVCTKRVVYLK